MGTMKYTVTTTTSTCPFCGHVFSKKTSGAFEPLLAVCWPVTLPVRIPYWIIKYWGFGDPAIPTVGEEVTTCPSCSLPVRTNNLRIEHMNPEQLLNYKFRNWFRLAYVLGAILSFSLIFSIPSFTSTPVLWSVIALLSFIGISGLITTYRILKMKTSTRKATPQKQSKKETARHGMYCRICGKKLPADSEFCNACGTKVIEN